MRIPILRGLIDRRILVNFRIEPEVLARFLPRPFRPQLVEGMGMAGICLIRLKQLRPRWLPAFAGFASENAAHRIAVEWDDHGTRQSGVYIPRRDSSSRLNALAGGRLFPGVHHFSRFRIHESGEEYSVEVTNGDGTHVTVAGRTATDLPDESVFASLSQASEFFARGALGYSATGCPGVFDGLELCTLNWHVEPLAVRRVESSFFEDRSVFPAGSVHFDCALLMRHVEHEWHGREMLTCHPCSTAPCGDGFITSQGHTSWGAWFPGNELRNAGRQETPKNAICPVLVPAFLPSSFHPGSLPTGNVLPKEFKFRARIVRE